MKSLVIEDDINDTIYIILEQWPNVTNDFDFIVKKEALLWKQLCVASENKESTFIDALNKCNKIIFPNIYNILKLCATIPITVASAERSFSSLKRIKTYLRNSTGENRLNGLAALSIHREFNVHPEKIIEIFTKTNLNLLLF